MNAVTVISWFNQLTAYSSLTKVYQLSSKENTACFVIGYLMMMPQQRDVRIWMEVGGYLSVVI
jgi:hypothetical protein